MTRTIYSVSGKPGAQLFAYACGSPIRQPVIEAIAKGALADGYFGHSNPTYSGGDSVVWGLIRGAQEIMAQTREAGFSFYQVDNAYFGRNAFYRVTKNALQIRRLPNAVVSNRYVSILSAFNQKILPWRVSRNGPIVLCPSSEFLHRSNGHTVAHWVESVRSRIRAATERECMVRYKELVPSGDIDSVIANAWCVVTHVSAAGLDALRLGIPVVTTGDCAATPLSTPIDQIETPVMGEGRDELFSLLACSQFTVEEMSKSNVLAEVDRLDSL